MCARPGSIRSSTFKRQRILQSTRWWPNVVHYIGLQASCQPTPPECFVVFVCGGVAGWGGLQGCTWGSLSILKTAGRPSKLIQGLRLFLHTLRLPPVSDRYALPIMNPSNLAIYLNIRHPMLCLQDPANQVAPNVFSPIYTLPSQIENTLTLQLQKTIHTKLHRRARNKPGPRRPMLNPAPNKPNESTKPWSDAKPAPHKI